MLCVAVALYAIARTTEEGSGRWLVVGSAALALLALTRVAYGWVLTLMLLGLLVWWVVSRSHQARRLGAMVGLALALCAPWLAYTASETGRFFQWGNSGGLSLYWMSSPHPNDLGDWRQANQVFTDEALAPHRPFFETLRGLPLPEQNARLEREALANIVGHPLEYATNVAANVSRLLFDAPYSGTPQRLLRSGSRSRTRCSSAWRSLPGRDRTRARPVAPGGAPVRAVRRLRPRAARPRRRLSADAAPHCSGRRVVRRRRRREPCADRRDCSGARLRVPMTRGDLR